MILTAFVFSVHGTESCFATSAFHSLVLFPPLQLGLCFKISILILKKHQHLGLKGLIHLTLTNCHGTIQPYTKYTCSNNATFADFVYIFPLQNIRDTKPPHRKQFQPKWFKIWPILICHQQWPYCPCHISKYFLFGCCF